MNQIVFIYLVNPLFHTVAQEQHFKHCILFFPSILCNKKILKILSKEKKNSWDKGLIHASHELSLSEHGKPQE